MRPPDCLTPVDPPRSAARRRGRGVTLLAGSGLLVLTGCWQVAGFIAGHEVESRVGACSGAMREVREELGRSRHVVHGDQDDSNGSRVFVHEWHYPERGDTAVIFTWAPYGVHCDVWRGPASLPGSEILDRR
jgi:hypothetical protein